MNLIGGEMDTLEIGELRQVVLFYNGSQTAVRLTIEQLFKEQEEEDEVVFGEISFRHPTPWERGEMEGEMLIGEARVISKSQMSIPDMAWFTSLQKSEQKILRAATQRVYLKLHPGSRELPTHNLDQVIAINGRQTAEKILRSN